MRVQAKNLVTEVPTTDPEVAATHFRSRFAFETDCWDVHATQDFEDRGFVLIDVRSREAFRGGHLPGSINIPRRKLSRDKLSHYPADTLFVVYCAGPHCNGSTRAAARIAELGRPVKEMVGGTTGWLDEGFTLETS